MTTPSRLGALATTLLLAAVLTACGGTGDGDTDEQPSDPPTGEAAESPMAQEAIVQTAETGLGTILVDGDGLTLYLFTNDSPGVSTCEDACLAAWPPLLGTPEAGEGAAGSLLGTLERSDGSTQVSYNGWPLYYWAGDLAAGDTSGQGVNDVWFVVSPEGDPLGVTP